MTSGEQHRPHRHSKAGPHVDHHRPSNQPAHRLERIRPWWLWIATAFAFPPAGYFAHKVAGPVDGVGAALVSGLIAGAVIGAAQWAVLRRRGASPRWIVATAGGFAVGLAAGAALVDYATSLAALVVMGAVTGAVIGLAQAAASPRSVATRVSWTLVTAHCGRSGGR